MHPRVIKPFLWLGVLLVIVGMACNLGSTPTAQPTEAVVQALDTPTQPSVVEETEATETPTEAAETGAVSTLKDVKSAIIQIEAQGTFIDPEFGLQVNAAGRGSGFIIDPSGIAVTNNHVVTGAALLKVWVGGNKDRSYNAKVLGVSECSDLAVIDIDGDGFNYLNWYEEDIDVGLEVNVAGFPLGDPEYSLNRGIISKARADGETNWASVDSVIEYDATSNPGNSGGPVVDSNGNVLGVHYAGSSSTRQAFGISRDIAISVIELLRDGKDVDSIGVNGQAVVSEDGSISGIWVSSVKSGSPADKAGVAGGDIITILEGLVLASDGTMSDYCDILRTHNPGDTLSIEVLRWLNQEYLSGQLNGRELATVASFGTELETEVQTSGGDADTYTNYVTWTDSYSAIEIDVPEEWGDVDGSPWVDDNETIGASITAAADLEAFQNTWTESGVFFGASDDLATLGGYVQLLDIFKVDFESSCKYEGRTDYGSGDYEDPLYRGKFDLFSNCGDTGSWFLILSAVPKDDSQAYLILVQLQIVKDADLDALDRILQTFQVVGSLP